MIDDLYFFLWLISIYLFQRLSSYLAYLFAVANEHQIKLCSLQLTKLQKRIFHSYNRKLGGNETIQL